MALNKTGELKIEQSPCAVCGAPASRIVSGIALCETCAEKREAKDSAIKEAQEALSTKKT